MLEFEARLDDVDKRRLESRLAVELRGRWIWDTAKIFLSGRYAVGFSAVVIMAWLGQLPETMGFVETYVIQRLEGGFFFIGSIVASYIILALNVHRVIMAKDLMWQALRLAERHAKKRGVRG